MVLLAMHLWSFYALAFSAFHVFIILKHYFHSQTSLNMSVRFSLKNPPKWFDLLTPNREIGDQDLRRNEKKSFLRTTGIHH